MSPYDSKGHSHWNDFYQLPVSNGGTADIMIRFLWSVLHYDYDLSYNAAEDFASAAITLIDLVWSPSFWNFLVWPFTRPRITRVLCAIDTVLDSEEHLDDTCHDLVRDISREIDSGSVVFSASLRDRCEAANLTIERETRRMQNAIYRLRRDFDPTRLCYIYTRLSFVCVGLCAAVLFPTLVASLFFTVSSKYEIRGFTFAFLMGFLAQEGSQRERYLNNIATNNNRVNMEAITYIWAWRDMRGLLALIAESQLFDVPHAKLFLDSFQTSFMGGGVELWKTRSKIRTLTKFADKVRAMKKQDAYDDATGSLLARPWYRNAALRLGRCIREKFYTQVSGSDSRQ
ncbi:hypothetical protein ARMGADRAFT_1092071 [Armillaria gallica]|uniref:Uncharacterized protein n=1 Tax=Armillaria gallica TaxID=47427 RepID=A0A2H3CC64_ARMGA|nr:hypothetical protein ARMGADRAFT_1092071 [Armillaria gallica]